MSETVLRTEMAVVYPIYDERARLLYKGEQIGGKIIQLFGFSINLPY